MRLSVWVSISFGIAIATSQTAFSWQAQNLMASNVEFLDCTEDDCSKETKNFDGPLAYGQIVSCDGNGTDCGAGAGLYISVAVNLPKEPNHSPQRFLYKRAVHVTPQGMVIFREDGYYNLYQSAPDQGLKRTIPMPAPIQQVHCPDYGYNGGGMVWLDLPKICHAAM